jgi:hypothetical protein
MKSHRMDEQPVNDGCLKFWSGHLKSQCILFHSVALTLVYHAEGEYSYVLITWKSLVAALLMKCMILVYVSEPTHTCSPHETAFSMDMQCLSVYSQLLIRTDHMKARKSFLSPLSFPHSFPPFPPHHFHCGYQ